MAHFLASLLLGKVTGSDTGNEFLRSTVKIRLVIHDLSLLTTNFHIHKLLTFDKPSQQMHFNNQSFYSAEATVAIARLYHVLVFYLVASLCNFA
jgi:hypothetical protein